MTDVSRMPLEKVTVNDCDNYPQIYYCFSFGDKTLYIKKGRGDYKVVGFGIGVPLYSQAGCDVYFQHRDLSKCVERFKHIVYCLMEPYFKKMDTIQDKQELQYVLSI